MYFTQLSQAFEDLEGISGRKLLVQRLSQLFGELDVAEIDLVIYLCQGRIAPRFEPLEIGLGEKLVAESIGRAYGKSRDEVLQIYARQGDLGLVAAELAADHTAEVGEGLSVYVVFNTLHEIATTSGAGAIERKTGLLSSLLGQADPVSAKHLVRIPLGRLRLGIGDPTILDALSQAKVGDTSLRKPIERAYNRVSDLGLLARKLWEGGLADVEAIGIQVGKPIRPALAERLPSAEAIIAKLGRCAVEPKFDGFRCQVHKDHDRIHIYSRNLEDMSAMFPEIVEGAREQIRAKTAILEGEAVGYNPDSEEYLAFQETTRRRRKYQVAEMAQSLPLRLFAFDLMYLDGQDYTEMPYWERQQKLAQIISEDTAVAVTTVQITETSDELQAFLLDCVQKGLEGIVAKKLDSSYQAGARNFNWVKLKRAQAGQLQDTVDCVILGYVYGRGKRTAFGAGALLVGVYDAERDEFATVSRIGTGLTDEEWRQIRERCDRITVDHKPSRVNSQLVPSVWVEPSVVIEVLADEITRSPVHSAGRIDQEPGYALRFPRLVSFRGDDKGPEDATTVQEIISMYEEQTALRSRPSARSGKPDHQDRVSKR